MSVRIIPLEPKSTGYGPPIPIGRTMIPFIKKYAKAIVAAIGYAASIATALGLTHYHYVSVILGVLSTIAVILTKNTASAAPANAPAASGK